MSDQSILNIAPIVQQQENSLTQVLSEADFLELVELKDELADTWRKKQVFRTETEMRYGVLNDASFPTKASKYWQCVREQNSFFEELISLSFEYRKNEVEIKQVQREIDREQDELERELLQISLEQKTYKKSNMELMAKHRIRELKQWSLLKKELDDGSFDNEDVNSHQKESLTKQLQIRAANITSNSAPADVANILGVLATLKKEDFKNELKLPVSASEAGQ